MLLPAGAVVLPRARVRVLAGAALVVRLAVVVKVLAASETVRLWDPARIRVAEKVPWPLTRVESAGMITPAAVSLLLKWTVPLYVGTGFPASSSAVTPTLNGSPAVTVAGSVSLRSLTRGWPVMKAFRMVAVICWMRGSVWADVQVLSRAQLQDEVPVANTQALLGAW